MPEIALYNLNYINIHSLPLHKVLLYYNTRHWSMSVYGKVKDPPRNSAYVKFRHQK